MVALTYFTARLYFEAITADELDSNTDPETKGVNAGVTFTPILYDNTTTKPATSLTKALQAGTLTPNIALLALAPIRARIDDGRLKLRADESYNIIATVATYSALPAGLNNTTDIGKAWQVDADKLVYVWNGTTFPANGTGDTTTDQPDVRLVADTAVLNLTPLHLGYKMVFDHVHYNNAEQDWANLTFAFQAPTSDTVLDLTTATRVTL